MSTDPIVAAVFTGQPKSMTDERGAWTSSIYRERTHAPVEVTVDGLAGDKVTQPYHGGRGAAICVHLADHYAFWNAHLGMHLQPGNVGENLTLANIPEDQICVGDRIRLGTAIVQVSAPRVPCATLARRIGRTDWVKRTIRENRTGFYLRVLEPGTLQQGDPWLLEERINPTGSIPAINQCFYLNFDPAYAQTMLDMPGLEPWWKEQVREKLQNHATHWTSSMKDGGNP